MNERATKRQLCEILGDARRRTIDLIDPLDEDQWIGPELGLVNPPLWEIGHLAWFHERWTLRDLDGREPMREDADELYDSIAIDHEDRWELALPSYEETREYMAGVREAMEARLPDGEASDLETFRYRYTALHEDMHVEAFTYTRQTLGYRAPSYRESPALEPRRLRRGNGEVDPADDVEIPGGSFLVGAPNGAAFAFDNERLAHEVEIDPFAISRTPVTNGQFLEFVEAGGYDERDYWSDAGWRWRCDAAADSPVYWIRDGDTWRRQSFDAIVELNPDAPVVHVNWWEAHAYCRWKGRRLPTEFEWEVAAAGEPDGRGNLAATKRRFPWGDDPSEALACANVDGISAVEGTDRPWPREYADVDACPAGDSAFGCRQMLGNVWEWTASPFEPFPGFEPDMYEDYSEPWFGDRRVLRGGSWATRLRMAYNTYRNYFPPERRDIFAGFRTCPDN